MTLPNKLTMGRLVLALVTFSLLWMRTAASYDAAFVACAFAVATDWVDGWLARRRGEVSAFGAMADPLADKVLVIGVLVALMRDPNVFIPAWAVFVIIVRELLIGGLRGLAALQRTLIPADRSGKWKMAAQSCVVLALIALAAARARGVLPGAEPRDPLSGSLAALAAVVSLLSGIQYLYNGRNVLYGSWDAQKGGRPRE